MIAIDLLFSLLSLSPNVDIGVFIAEHAIPNCCGVISILFCILKIVNKYKQRRNVFSRNENKEIKLTK